jgi:hypothetical protein
MRTRTPPSGFRYVTATHEETEEYRRTHNHRYPAMYRLECISCGKRIWGSGIGTGAHRRACAGAKAAWNAD